MFRFTYNEKEYEYRGEYREVTSTDHFIAISTGGRLVLDPSQDNAGLGVRAIVHPVPVRHTFGGIVFEETGEKRPTVFGEWFLNQSGYPEGWYLARSACTSYKILRRVEVTNGQDD